MEVVVVVAVVVPDVVGVVNEQSSSLMKETNPSRAINFGAPANMWHWS